MLLRKWETGAVKHVETCMQIQYLRQKQCFDNSVECLSSGISMPFVLFFPQFLHTVPTCVQFLEKAHLAGPYITFYFCQTVLSSMF